MWCNRSSRTQKGKGLFELEGLEALPLNLMMPFITSYMRQRISSWHPKSNHITCSEVRNKPTFCNCVSNLLHSSFFCSIAISSDLSLESFFKPEDASEEACSFRSMRLDCRWTDGTRCQSSNQSISVSKPTQSTGQAHVLPSRKKPTPGATSACTLTDLLLC